MKKLYGGLHMGWLQVIAFAAAAGVYTGLVMIPSVLENTSFQDIGISYEWWVIFAVIVVVNCHHGWEAMLKCFAFFLISQPLVYAVQVAAGTLALQDGWGYYWNIWLPMTFLTLPGGFIAYYCKKQNALGGVILGLGNTIQLGMGVVYTVMLLRSFPHHLLSALVSYASIIVMGLYIQTERRNRLISWVLPVFLVTAIIVLAKMTGRVLV